jgi:hypothetical protein
MSAQDVLQSASAELDRLTEELVRSSSMTVPPLKTVESILERIAPLEEALSLEHARELQGLLQEVLTKAKRVQALLEAGTTFHCQSIFGRQQTHDIYSSDGTFNPSHDSRIVFQG